MVDVSRPFSIHLNNHGGGSVKSSCRDSSGALVRVPHSVQVAMQFDSRRRGLTGGTARIILNDATNGTTTANPALVGRFAMPHVTRVHRAVRV